MDLLSSAVNGLLTEAAEVALVARCRAGDRAAWAELYQVFGPPLARFLRRATGPDEDVDDLVQQVFVECFRSLGRFRGESRLGTWLYGMAGNVAAKSRRSWFRLRRRTEAYGGEAERLAELPDEGPEGRVEARARLAAVERALQGIGAKHRVVWVMAEVEGLSGEEIARALDVGHATVRTRLSKARRKVLLALEALAATEAREGRVPASGVSVARQGRVSP